MSENAIVRLDLMRDSAKAFPVIAAPAKVKAARIWYCKYASLNALSECLNLEELVIAGLPEKSLDFLAPLKNLKTLFILDMPKIANIGPLSCLKNLEVLSLATNPSWDASNKRTIVESLSPIADLPRLKHLELFGVVPEDSSLLPVMAVTGLVTALFSKYPEDEVRRVYASGVAQAHAPRSSFA